MIIVSVEEFNRQVINNLSGKVFHNTIVIPGVVFSIHRRQVAINYCQELSKRYPSVQCILVEDNHYVEVWYDQGSSPILKTNPNYKTQPKISLKKNRPAQSLLESRYLPIDRTFVFLCQGILIEAIGPIAKIIIRKTISQNTKSNRQQFIARLIREIHQTGYSEDVEQQLKQLLSN